MNGNQGYGYQVWQSKWPGSYRADGAMGQYSVVVSDADLVVVILGMKLYGHEELACIWNQLMPGIKNEPLKPEKKLQQRLDKLCASAKLPLPHYAAKRIGNQAKGALGHTLQLTHNRFGLQQLMVGDGHLHLAYDDGCEETFAMGNGDWRYSTLNGYPYYSINSINRMRGFNNGFTAAAAYLWTSSSTLEVRVHYVDWISGLVFNFDFDKQEVTVRDTYPNSKPVIIPFTIQ